MADARLAIHKYLERGAFPDAIRTGQAALARVADPAKAIPGGPVAPSSDPEKALRAEIAQGQASMHDLLGESYEAAGRASDAQTEYGLARALRNAARP